MKKIETKKIVYYKLVWHDWAEFFFDKECNYLKYPNDSLIEFWHKADPINRVYGEDHDKVLAIIPVEDIKMIVSIEETVEEEIELEYDEDELK